MNHWLNPNIITQLQWKNIQILDIHIVPCVIQHVSIRKELSTAVIVVNDSISTADFSATHFTKAT